MTDTSEEWRMRRALKADSDDAEPTLRHLFPYMKRKKMLAFTGIMLTSSASASCELTGHT